MFGGWYVYVRVPRSEAGIEVSKMLEGITDLDQLDIFKQRVMADFTRSFLQLYLKPKWFRSSLVLGQARDYFSNYVVDENILLNQKLTEEIEEFHPSIKEYLCWIMLDFAMLDPSLEEVPVGWAFQFAEDLSLKETFDKIVNNHQLFNDNEMVKERDKFFIPK